MPQFSEEYQRSDDIDWFARIGRIHIHAMSFGGLLPNTIDRYNNTKLLYAAYRINPFVEHFFINEEYIHTRIAKMVEGGDERMIRDRYLRHFLEMASRGFFSFDRDLNEENKYHLIVRPSEIQEIDFGRLVVPTITEENMTERSERDMTFVF